jgi:hypothetical protein
MAELFHGPDAGAPIAAAVRLVSSGVQEKIILVRARIERAYFSIGLLESAAPLAVDLDHGGGPLLPSLRKKRELVALDEARQARLKWPRHLAEIPEQARHDGKCLLGHRQQNVLVGRVLRAAGIGMRHPDRRQAKTF